jgi:hypothetical protein
MLPLDDLLSTLDVLAIDRQALDLYGAESQASIDDKRRIAVNDWLAGELTARGFDPSKHQSRRAPESAYLVSAASVGDITALISSRANSPVNLADLVQAPSTDAILLGLREPYRGIAVTMIGSVNASTLSAASLTYWTGGRWDAVDSLTDGTASTDPPGASFAGGGVLRFDLPERWTPRPAVSPDQAWLYYTRIGLTAACSSLVQVSQLLPIPRSRLTTPAALYALHLLYLEAAAGGRANYEDRAEQFAKKAYTALERQGPFLAEEFDADETGSVEIGEAASLTPAPVDLNTWERG